MHPSSGSAPVAAVRAGALPVDLTSFIDRRDEVAEIRRMLGVARLVTLGGIGGVGKTRLALRVGSETRRAFADGVWFVDLSAVRDPMLVPQAAINALGLGANLARSPMDVLIDHLRQRQALLIMDNCEHLLDASADLIATLLRTGANLRVLATSRQALGVPGEQLISVTPLTVPSDDETREGGAVAREPALALFADRAAAVVPGFRITPENHAAATRLCRELDGMPLAIELAAVRLRVLSVGDLAARLTRRFQLLTTGGHTTPVRHQTLWATIDWSYELCTAFERTLWARASVFVGGFDLRAVEAVCCDDALPVDSVLDVLAGLVDKSILLREEHAGGLRFRFLETLREFGQTRLAEQGMSTESGRRHRDWYRQIIDDACARWFGPDQEMLCTSLHLEQANVREAIAFCLREPGEARVAQHMAGRPWFLWHVLFLTEGRQWLERVLDADTTPSPERARALATCGNVAAVQGDAAVARDRLVESQATSLELGDHATFAYACQVLGMSMVFTEPGQARDVLLTAIPLNESVQGAEDIVVAARLQLGAARLMEGDTATALEQFERCRDLCQTKGERWQLSYAYWGLGFAALIRGELKDAIAFARRSLMIKRAFRDLLGEAVVLDLLAWTHAASGDGESAAVLMGAASRLWRTFGQELFGSRQWAAPRERAERQAREAAGDRAFEAGLTRGKQLSLDEALAYALDEHPRSGSTPTGTQTALTRREREIAALIAEGLSNKEIAQRLVISHRTAEGHVEHILTKLGITSRAQIARRMNDPDRHSMP